ncbi:MAG: MBL fold metallo-hydrolase [Planctomycetota bacterium]|jgi:glyoxylase-like metal-dependent hydrolase (beta-lactamase superfamily II)
MQVLEGDGVRVRTLDAGSLWLDGGAMFGVVPKPLWARRTVADDRNRIPLAMRCLLVETGGLRLLVDTGLGGKESQKFREIYRVANQGSPTRLEDSLRALELAPEAIDVVVNTHLHFDHAGGNTLRGEDGALHAAFPNARYLIRREEWEFAHRDNERVRASYIADNFVPLRQEGRVEFVDHDSEVAPGVHVLHTPGHTPGHQSVLIDVGGCRLLYLADLAPTKAHIPLAWIMGYDVEPLVTLESKRRVLGRAAEEGWMLAFEHDPLVAWGRAVKPEGGGEGCVLTEEVSDPLLEGVAASAQERRPARPTAG